jgi:hypothetical protein
LSTGDANERGARRGESGGGWPTQRWRPHQESILIDEPHYELVVARIILRDEHPFRFLTTKFSNDRQRVIALLMLSLFAKLCELEIDGPWSWQGSLSKEEREPGTAQEKRKLLCGELWRPQRRYGRAGISSAEHKKP